MVSFKGDLLLGKTALITGASGLLGPRHARALASSGADLILIDIDDKKLNLVKDKILTEFPNIDTQSFLVDITDFKLISELADNLNNKGKKVDILINNAALNPKMKNDSEFSGRVEDYDMDLWHSEINVGLTGSFICSRVFGEMMKINGSGVIVNISSDLAIRAPDQRVYSPTETFDDIKQFKPIGYSVVKTALIGMTKYLAEYWGRFGIRVNALLPGGVLDGQQEHIIKNVEKRTLLGRWANIDEYEDAIVFLSSDASAYMTGQSIIIDGGRSV